MSLSARRFARAVKLPVSGVPPIFQSIWQDSDLPATVNDNDPSSIEVGLKFQSDIPMYVAGVRFYKGNQNTGIHIGSLWNSGGTSLGTVTFAHESASGWQAVYFSSPIAINANTTYIVSYLAPSGHYSSDSGYFSASGTTRGNLTALSDSVAVGNGVYAYSATSTFPNQTYGSANYWVDVIASATSFSDTNPPSTPTGLVATAADGSTASLSWVASTDDVAVSYYEVLRDGVPAGTTSTISYVDTGLIPNTTYSYAVKAYDTTGKSSTASAAINVTTSVDTTPPTTPSDVTLSALSASEMSVSWVASTDDVALDHYAVFRDGIQIGTTTINVFVDATVNAGIMYSYAIQAYDTANNMSALSVAASAVAGTTWTLSSWPDASNTGWQPTNVTLQTLTDASNGTGWHCDNLNGTSKLYVTDDGAVLDSLDIYDRYLHIQANNVTITRSRMRNGGYYCIYIEPGLTGLTIEDCEIDGAGDTVNFTICINASLHATFRRCNIYNMASSGPRIGTGNLMEDCWLHDYQHGDGGHEAGISTNSDEHGVVIRHNNITINTAGASSCIAEYRDFGTPYDITIQNNLINGGNYGMMSAITDSLQTFSPTNGLRFIGNTFGRELYPECGYYGPIAGYSSTNGVGNIWIGNVWGGGAAATASHTTGDLVIP